MTNLLELDDELPRVLVLVNAQRNTEIIAAAVGAGLEQRGFHVELGDAANRPPPPADYDAVVIGLAVGYLRDRVIESYLACFRSGLCDVPVAMFFIGTPRRCAHAVDHAASEIGREPDVVATFPRRIFPWLPLWIEPHQIAELTERLAVAFARARDDVSAGGSPSSDGRGSPSAASS